MLNEFYRIAFRKRLYPSIGDLQDDLDLWVKSYNEERPHQARWCFGKTPLQPFLDAIAIAISGILLWPIGNFGLDIGAVTMLTVVIGQVLIYVVSRDIPGNDPATVLHKLRDQAML